MVFKNKRTLKGTQIIFVTYKIKSATMTDRSHPRKHHSIITICICILMGCTPTKETTGDSTSAIISFVNPFIGTDGEGNTHPGAVRPFGMVAISPQTFDFTKTQLPTGYRHGEDKIFGFSCVNFSGVGCPATGSVPLKFSTRSIEEKTIGSTYTDEVASPGYYSVKLVDENIGVRSTATTRSGLFELALPKGKSYIFLDLMAQQGHLKGGKIENYTSSSVSGFQLEGFFCGSNNRSNTYFNIELDKPSDSVQLIFRNKETGFKEGLSGEPSGIVYIFDNEKPAVLHIKVGVSFVSSKNAKENMDTEQVGFDFEKVKSEAEKSWEDELKKIMISETSKDEKSIFYTALYHCLLMPITFSDANGEYIKQGSKSQIGKAEGYTRYTAFSLWDTYRTTHPLFILAYPERQLDMLKTMTGMYEESGWMLKWEIFGSEPNLMVGDPAAIVIGDSYVKGIRSFNAAKAYEGLTKQADQWEGNRMRTGLKEYLSLGYISMDGEFGDAQNFEWNNGQVWGTVSNTMEFNLSDYNLAQMAKAMGKQDDYKRYLKRSMSFLKLYDPETGLIRPKNKNGSWYEPFDPTQGLWDKMRSGLRGGPGFTEGSAWQYLYAIPHGIDTLKSIMGEQRFTSHLDSIFDKNYFDMTNEVDLGFPFFYNYTAERNFKTAQKVHGLLSKYFLNAENGIPGNDDAGAMSAWVVFAKMGIYPDTPGKPSYLVTVPSYDHVTVTLNPDFYKGSSFTIERKGPLDGTIKSIELNNKPIGYSVNHFDLTAGKSVLTIETNTSPIVKK